MAGEDRITGHTLAERLGRAPYRFHFYQAVRLLENYHREKPRVGNSIKPAQDPVRFAQEPSLAFASSSITAYHPDTEAGPARLMVSFLGLLGPNGPMPLHLTEHARNRLLNHSDATFARFLDVFNHRMASLFYRAWANSQAAVSFDRPDEDHFTRYVGSMFGLGMDSFRHRDTVQDLAKLYYSGRLSSHTRNPEGLASILSEYFNLEVEIEQFIGHWIELPYDSVCRLGESPWTGSLGTTTVLGTKIWDCQQKFRVKLGPMHYNDYQRMLPGGDSFMRMVAWVSHYVGDELSWDVELVLCAKDVPTTSLGVCGELGWSTWVSSQPFEEDVITIVSSPNDS